MYDIDSHDTVCVCVCWLYNKHHTGSVNDTRKGHLKHESVLRL